VRFLTRPVAPISIAWVVWLAWLAWTVALFAAVRIYGSDIPFADDYWTWTGFLTGERQWTAAELRWPHNGHRIGAALVLMGLTYEATGSPVLAMLYVNAVLLSATAALFLWAVRRWRGRLVATDSLIPVVLLNWGHLEIVLWAMCVHWTLFLVCLGGVAVVAAGSPRRLSPGASALCAGLLLVMTQSFGAGLVVALAMSPWLLVATWPRRDEPQTSPRRRAVARCAAVGVCLLVLATVAATWPAAGESIVARHWGEALVLGMPHVLANMFGCLALDLWHALPMPAVLLTVSAFVLLARRAWTAPHERARLLAFALLLLGFCLVALGTSRARADLHPIRYGTLMAVPYVLIYAVWSCCGGGRRNEVANRSAIRDGTLITVPFALIYAVWSWSGSVGRERIVCWFLCVLAWTTSPWNSLIGADAARFRLELDTQFVTHLRAGMPVAELAWVHCKHFPPDCGSETRHLERFLRDLHRERVGMFAGLNVTDRWPGMEGIERGAQ
jgi:hypothetical protein